MKKIQVHMNKEIWILQKLGGRMQIKDKPVEKYFEIHAVFAYWNSSMGSLKFQNTLYPLQHTVF